MTTEHPRINEGVVMPVVSLHGDTLVNDSQVDDSSTPHPRFQKDLHFFVFQNDLFAVFRNGLNFFVFQHGLLFFCIPKWPSIFLYS